jgi:Protein of unknown function (DUF664)
VNCLNSRISVIGAIVSVVTPVDLKADLHSYLRDARQAVLWKLDGLSEYDVRRPLVPTGTNLLGLVKHLATVEWGHFGAAFGRPFAESLPWVDDPDGEPNADMGRRRASRATGSSGSTSRSRRTRTP